MNESTIPVNTPERLDTFLTDHLNASRSAIAALIKKSAVRVDGRVVTKPGRRLKSGEEVHVTLPETDRSEAERIPDFDVEVLYEDEAILVINKPSGVVVHPAPSYDGATLVDWLKARGMRLSTISGEERHGIVHRLDKETSGAMVVAKTNEAHTALSEQLQDRTMGRYYLALLDLPLKDDLTIDAPIARNPKNRLKMGVVPGGKEARSAFARLCLSRDGKHELIAARLFTGRTHQIRVHLSHIQRHILGDGLYGYKGNDSKIKRVFLHAYLLYLVHPTTGERRMFTAPVPEDFQALLERGFKKDDYHETLSTEYIIDRFSSLDDRV